MEGAVGAGGDSVGIVSVDLNAIVLPDGPTTRGAATSLRAEAFGWALPLVAIENLVPTNGRTTRSSKKACERPPHAQWVLQVLRDEVEGGVGGGGFVGAGP